MNTKYNMDMDMDMDMDTDMDMAWTCACHVRIVCSHASVTSHRHT